MIRLALVWAAGLALTAGEAWAADVFISEFLALNSTGRVDVLGNRSDWIELHNLSGSSLNLTGWYLTDNAGNLAKWQFPAATSIPANGYLVVVADSSSTSVISGELHANFALSGGGEYLALVKPGGTAIADAYSPGYPPQETDVSYGIGATNEHRYLTAPTPGGPNNFVGYSQTCGETKFSQERGFYTNPIGVSMTCLTPNAEIRYTTNGSAPTASSTRYTGPVTITKTTCLRAAAFRSGYRPSDPVTHTYIFPDKVIQQSATPPPGWPTSWPGSVPNKADYEMNPAIVSGNEAAMTNALTLLPTLSLVTPIANLFDPATGLYVNPEAAWERWVSAEWIETNNTSRFQIDCGLQIEGANSLSQRKKGLSLRFRGVYGAARLAKDLFSGNAVSSFDALRLRISGNDSWSGGDTHGLFIKDEMVRRTHLAMGRVSSHGRFVHVYLNGLYWGLYNLTEDYSDKFAAAYYGGEADMWQVSGGAPEDGAWPAMISVLKNNPASNATYQRVQGNNPDGTRNTAYPIYLDVDDYIDYMILMLWSGESDWPNHNFKVMYCRNEAVSAGWKFGVYDAEGSLFTGLDVYNGGQVGVAEMHSLLSSNAEYRLRFADRAQKHLLNGGALSADAAGRRFRDLAAEVEPVMIAENARWGDSGTVAKWREARDYVQNTFIPGRPVPLSRLFMDRALYPNMNAPEFSVSGGVFTNSLSLVVSAENPIYYTVDGSDPREYGTGAAVGTLYTDVITLTRTARVKARARSAGGEWSALTEAVFTRAEKPALRVTELMYHPRKAMGVETNGGYNADDFGFIELCNAGVEPIGLAGLHFTKGVTFDFPDLAVPVLNPGEYLLVVKNLAAFTARYPSVPPSRIAGVFAFPATNLDNAGEKIEIEDAAGRKVVSFTYNNRWQPATDGAGHSLVPASDVAQADGELDYPGYWKASVYIGGSPGVAEPASPSPSPSLVLNEIVAHTDINSPPYDSNDGIELYNTTGSSIALGAGWYLSDDPGNLTKWAIPATNTVAAHGWRYFDEMHDFHNPITSGFGLNKAGEQVLLSYLPGTAQDRVVDAVAFRAQENGVSLARYPNGAASWFNGVPTPGTSNQLTAAGVVISEVIYHPAPTVANPENNENDEYVELYNPTAQAIGLTNVVNDVGGDWRLGGGIGYLFPAGTVLPAGGRLRVVSFDPVTNIVARNAFLAAYGLVSGQIPLLGPYSGHLSNQSDTVRLERPVFGDPPAPLDDISWHVVDEVTYSATLLVTDRSNVAVPEGGAATFRVKLSTPPTGVVTVAALRTDGDGDITVSGGASLTFGPGDWDTYQTVTLAAAEDGDVRHGAATITCSAAGFQRVNVTATEADNDAAVKATGGTVVHYTLNGTNYAAHIFRNVGSSSFTPSATPLTVEYLVIGGGGGGGAGSGAGGGGAGGYRSSAVGEISGGGSGAESPIVLGSSAYTITIGAGGTGNTNMAGGSGAKGGDSSIAGSGIATITAVGGAGGAGNGQNAVAGGSGGGACRGSGGVGGSASSGTSGQGFAGGGAWDDGGEASAGGGGGGAGEDGGTDGSGEGGDGISSRITGSPVVRAGGGGPGASWINPAGGDGGGGMSNGGAGGGNTGGGGGGGTGGWAGGYGGSGIVIIRYVTGVAGGVDLAPTINTPASAGPNPVTLPAGTTVHVGVSAPDSDITYAWSKVSGPGTASFAAPAAAGSGVTFSAAGSYVLRVTVSDNFGGSATSDVTVYVNAAWNNLPVLVTTLAATQVTPDSARLNGKVNPRSSMTMARFDYGTTTAMEEIQPAEPHFLYGSTETPVMTVLTALRPHTKYYFRVHAHSENRDASGTVLNFTTGNRAPIAGDDTAAICPSGVLTLEVLGNDTDPDGDALSLVSFTAPPAAAGKVVKSGNTLVFTATATFPPSGTSFTYTIKDGFGGTDTATVTLTLAAAAIDPVTHTMPAASGSYQVGVLSNGGWRVLETLPWLSATPASGAADGTATITLLPNTLKTARTGTVNIAGLTHTITQGGVLPPQLTVPVPISDGIIGGTYTLPIPTTNAPVTYTAIGLPKGLSIVQVTGVITGRPTEAVTARSVTIKAINAAIATPVSITFPITIHPFPAAAGGTFTALVEPDAKINDDLGGHLTLTSTPLGALSSTLKLGAALHSLKGDWQIPVAGKATARLEVKRPGAASLWLDLLLDIADRSRPDVWLEGTVSESAPGTASAELGGYRHAWPTGTSPAPFAGSYTATLGAAVGPPGPGDTAPAGPGWLIFSTAANGTVTWSGKLADGTAIGGSSYLWPDRRFPVYQSLYTGKGSIIGQPMIEFPSKSISGALPWLKKPQTSLIYGGGLDLDLTVAGHGYTAPDAGQPVLGLSLVSAGQFNADLDFAGGGIESAAQAGALEQPCRITGTNTAVLATGITANPTAMRITQINAKTGFFTGTFTLKDRTPVVPRVVNFEGVLDSVLETGTGFFLLSELPVAPATSTAKTPKRTGTVHLLPRSGG